MRVALFVTVFGLCSIPAGTAQSLPQFGGGGGANYVGYAFVECTAANQPAVRLVLMQGVIPATLPASAPRPSLAVILPGSPDSVAAKEVTVSKDPAGPGQMVSCPVVGACVPAETGTVTIEPRGPTALTRVSSRRHGRRSRSARASSTWLEGFRKVLRVTSLRGRRGRGAQRRFRSPRSLPPSSIRGSRTRRDPRIPVSTPHTSQ